jgi:hypothetical protein
MSDENRNPTNDTAPMSGNVRECPAAEKSSQLDPSGFNSDPGPIDRKDIAVELLAMGRCSATVARMMGLDPRTLYRWRQESAFREALARRRQQLWSDLSTRLRGLAYPALDELERHLFDRYDRSRFRAASTILRLADVKRKGADSQEEAL